MTRITCLFAAALTVAALSAIPGCESMTLKVPASASEVAMGTGTTAYKADEPGTIYVYDRTWDKIRYSGTIHSGQLLTVDAQNNRILIDNQPVVEQVSLDPNARYEIFMDHHEPVVEKRTVIERDIHE